jgi:hypothetical protein
MTTGWGADGPRAAYQIIAATAAGDRTAVTTVLTGMSSPGELWGVVIALGAQARQAAAILGQDNAGDVRRRQRDLAARELRRAPAAALLAATALSPLPVTPPACCPGDADLDDAARCLARMTVATMSAAGWSPRAVRVLCDRACGLRR